VPPDNLWLSPVDPDNRLPMAATAENLARRYAVTRREQDGDAHRSHMAAALVVTSRGSQRSCR